MVVHAMQGGFWFQMALVCDDGCKPGGVVQQVFATAPDPIGRSVAMIGQGFG